MAANLTLAEVKSMRDNLVTAYTTLATSPTMQYQLGDRMFTYADRGKLFDEISRLTKLVLLLDTSVKVGQGNRADLRNWSR